METRGAADWIADSVASAMGDDVDGRSSTVGALMVVAESSSFWKDGSSSPCLEVPQFQHTSKESSIDSRHFVHCHMKAPHESGERPNDPAHLHRPLRWLRTP